MGFYFNIYRNFTKGDKDFLEEEVIVIYKVQDKIIFIGNGDRYKVIVLVFLEFCFIFIFMCLVVLFFNFGYFFFYLNFSEVWRIGQYFYV